MCGIAGLVPSDPRRSGARELHADVAVMLSAIAHRGPDGIGIQACGGAVLGHRRLAVIDLSPRAAQPMPLRCRARDEEGAAPRAWVALNGEIYNHVELRRELEARGHAFFSASDTEVILHLYEDAGEALLSRLRGMFALALWDARRRTLLLARDRMGEKPLFYAAGPDGLAFASELKALAALRRARGEPVEEDAAALRSYLALKYVPGPRTALRGVLKLPPGHLLTWRAGGVTLRPWWRLPDAAPESAESTPSAAALREELRERLGESVRMQLRSDVPLGLFLSGGVDSGILACLMAAAAPGRLRAFTIGFDEADYDEAPAAERIARRLGAEHVRIPMRADARAIADELPELAWRLDQPFADSSALAVHRLAREVRRHVTVALSGDGGDELFLGYDRYRAHRLAGRLERLPVGAVGLPSRLLRAATSARAGRRNLAGRSIRFAAGLGLPPLARNDAWIACFDAETAQRTFTADFLAGAAAAGGADPLQAVHDAYAEAGAGSLAAIQRADLAVWLPDDVLHKTDSMTMAHALESRAPFLDAEVVALAMRIPAALKVAGGLAGRGKAILRDAFARELPAPARRRRKAGFGLPLDHWLRGGLSDWARDLLLSAPALARGMLRRSGVEALLEEHRSGRANHDDAIWSLVMLEHWQRAFLQEPARGTEVPPGAVGEATA